MRKRLLSLLFAALLLGGGLSRPALGFWNRPQDVTLSVHEGRGNSQVELQVSAAKLGNAVEIRLQKSGQPDIVATNLRVIGKDQITAFLDLRGQAPGTWDVKVINHYRFLLLKFTRATVVERGFTITNPAVAVSGIAPRESLDQANVRLTITGAGFRPGVAVALVNGQVMRGAAQVVVVSDSIMACRFDLAGLAAGVYDLQVSGDDGQREVFRGAFAVKSLLGTANPLPVPVPQPGEGATGLTTAEAAPAANEQGPAAVPSNPAATPPQPADRRLKPVFFDFDKANLRPDQLAALDENVKYLLQHPQENVILCGHTDERGSQVYNRQLAARRAAAVQGYLTRKGIAAARIIVYIFGEDNPGQAGHNQKAWAYNRRVDILSSPERLGRDRAQQLARP